MDETDRDKLVKVLRMFGSDHDGEVAAAARRAHHIINIHALDWDDLIIQEGRRAKFGRKQRETKPESNNEEADMIRQCGERSMCLSAWENEFIASIGASILEWGRLTPKQRAVLDRIVTKLRLQGNWDEPT